MAFLNGHYIKHLMLHGLPWVNVETIQGIVPRMVKLKALGVHQCFLLTLGDTQTLLRGINETNAFRAEKNQPHINVDFTPYYYRGPPYKSDGTGHVGEYGIVPEEKDWLDSRKAIAAQLLGIRALCHKGDQDFFTRGTAFRAYLDRLPFRTMPSVLKCIEALHKFNTNKYHSRVAYKDLPRWCPTGTHYPDGNDKLPLISEEMKIAMEITLWIDLILACNGRAMLKEELWDVMVLRGTFKLTRCVECDQTMPACYFMSKVLARQECQVLCHGCQLGRYLSTHNFRLYSERRNLARDIFFSKRFYALSLVKVLKNIGRKSRQDETGDAISCRPGTFDVKFHIKAARLWKALTVELPEQLETIKAAIAYIDEEYDSLSYDERLQKAAKREVLERDALQLEFTLGLNQRNPTGQSGTLFCPCRSWELDIRDCRAELALEKGKFINRAPIPIFNFDSNVATMLGSLGSLPEYWNTTTSDDTTAKEETQQSDSSSLKSVDSDEGSPVDEGISPSSSISTMSLDHTQKDAIQKRPSFPTEDTTPKAAALKLPRSIEDLKPTQIPPLSPTREGSNEGPSLEARTPNRPMKHLRSPSPDEWTRQPATPRLLPHQRRGRQAPKQTQTIDQPKPFGYAAVATSQNRHSNKAAETAPPKPAAPELQEQLPPPTPCPAGPRPRNRILCVVMPTQSTTPLSRNSTPSQRRT